MAEQVKLLGVGVQRRGGLREVPLQPGEGVVAAGDREDHLGKVKNRPVEVLMVDLDVLIEVEIDFALEVVVGAKFLANLHRRGVGPGGLGQDDPHHVGVGGELVQKQLGVDLREERAGVLHEMAIRRGEVAELVRRSLVLVRLDLATAAK
ncbi:unnamed protein product [Phytomonas sp. Hart1]|nr:unnamed protein product [Phytomonas sp. Hart1]|eukprot:CCW70373.1 unnamed protein product [Phytomonas sp. isolate Hart1]